MIFPVAHSGDFTNSYLLYQWFADHEAPVSIQEGLVEENKPSSNRGVAVYKMTAASRDSQTDSSQTGSDSSDDSELEESAIIGRRLISSFCVYL
jgi:hypothetical protein